MTNDELIHYGILGMKWGVRRFQNKDGTLTSAGKKRFSSENESSNDDIDSLKERVIQVAYSVGVRLAPREHAYAIKRILNNPNQDVKTLADSALKLAKSEGVLPNNETLSNAIEKVGIEKHKNAKYDLDDVDLSNLKKYTNSARYSRQINSFLATGEPKQYSEESKILKDTLSKNKVDDTTVFRSCSLNFSFNGISKKLDTMSEKELAKSFDSFSKNYKGKTFKENRVFSTSTSPNFAIDIWRKVNPTAASSYNTYMIINTKNCPGILADGRTNSGKKIVNTRSNQEGILSPAKMKYESLSFDTERNMFVITVTAMGEEENQNG